MSDKNKIGEINKAYLKQGLDKIKRFKGIYLTQPAVGYSFFLSQWDKNAVSEYYKTKKYLKCIFQNDEELKKLEKNLPRHVWILKKYLFEIIFFSSALISFLVYIFYVPPFKGMISFFVPAIIFVHFLFSQWLKNISDKTCLIFEEIKKKMNEK